MIKYVIMGIVGGLLLLLTGLVIGANLSFIEPLCDECIQKITSCPTLESCPIVEQIKCNKTTNKELIDSMNNTYTIGLINQIQRCEKQIEHYQDSNSTVICSRLNERLEQCEQTLNQTRELLE